MEYLFVIAMVIRGELESLSTLLHDFQIIDDSGPNHCLGNRHPILLWKKEKLDSDQQAIARACLLFEKWRFQLNFDPYVSDGYIKTGHALLHSIDKDQAIWSEIENIEYLFDGVKSSNQEYQEYGIFVGE